MKHVFNLLFICLLMTGCSENDNETMKNTEQSSELNEEQSQKQEMLVSLTFQKEDAEQAMNFYVEVFEDAKINDVQRWGEEGPGKEGTIMMATFELNGMKFMCSDSPPVHDWDFSPAVAIYVECSNEEEIERIFSKFAENGEVAMPLDNYGFSEKFGWVIDEFGVSWQFNFE